MELLIPSLGAFLFIFIARVIDMALDVIRILMLMRDKHFVAAAIGFIEVSIFVIALNEVLSGGLDGPGKVIAYAGGFAVGTYIGGLIEQRLAIGYVSLQIFPQECQCDTVAESLRNRGFGVTKVAGEGRHGRRIILFAALKRKDVKQAVRILDELSPDVFFTISDARNIHGGTFPIKRKGY